MRAVNLRMASLFGVLALTILSGAIAKATLVDVVFSGSITDVPAGLASSFNIADAVSGSFQYDDSISPNAGGDASVSSFDAITDFGFTAGGYSAAFGAQTTGSSNIQVYNDLGPGNWDHISIVPFAPTLAGANIGDYVLQFAVLRFDDTTQTVFDDASLLPGSISFGDYDLHTFYFYFLNSVTQEFVGVTADITSVRTLPDDEEEPVIPEPASLSLVGLGLATLAGRLRRRRA